MITFSICFFKFSVFSKVFTYWIRSGAMDRWLQSKTNSFRQCSSIATGGLSFSESISLSFLETVDPILVILNDDSYWFQWSLLTSSNNVSGILASICGVFERGSGTGTQLHLCQLCKCWLPEANNFHDLQSRENTLVRSTHTRALKTHLSPRYTGFFFFSCHFFDVICKLLFWFNEHSQCAWQWTIHRRHRLGT